MITLSLARTAPIAGLILGATLLAGSPVWAAEAYAPVINPADFSTSIDNPFFNLPVGKIMHFNAKTEDGVETTEIVVTNEKRTLMGVETVVYWDRVYLNGKLKEETRDFLAQHRNGDVWYFGEEVDNYEDGKLKDHHGAWLAGVDGAQPGIWMKADPKVGETYKEEYYAGKAEDMAKVVSVSETVETPLGTFENCIKTDNTTPLEPKVLESKFYCREIGGQALELDVAEGIRDELVKIENGG